MRLFILILLLLIIFKRFLNKKENFTLMYRPKPNNSQNIKDSGILRNLDWTDNIFSMHREINHKELKKILNRLKGVKLNYINPNDHTNKTVLKISKHIISVLDKYSSHLDGDKTFSVRNTDILKSNKNRIVYNIEVFRNYKTHSFTIQINVNTKKKAFSEITLIGINIEDIKNDHPIITFEDHFKKSNVKFINRNNNFNINEYRCYNFRERKKIDCLSSNKFSKKDIWDKPCEKDSECPFYNSKFKNGGCNNGYCNLPINLEKVGYRGYKGIPLCKNCNRVNCKGVECHKCCKEKGRNAEYYF